MFLMIILPEKILFQNIFRISWIIMSVPTSLQFVTKSLLANFDWILIEQNV